MHPALHEAFGNVCMEAMAAGRPVVCLDIGGPAAQITPETGFAAPVTNPEEAVEAMAAFLTRLADNRDLLLEMSNKARARVRGEIYHAAARRCFRCLLRRGDYNACGNAPQTGVKRKRRLFPFFCDKRPGKVA